MNNITHFFCILCNLNVQRWLQICNRRKGNLARPKEAVQCVTFTQKRRLSVQERVSRNGAVTCGSQRGFKCVPKGTTPLNRIFRLRDSAATLWDQDVLSRQDHKADVKAHLQKVAALDMHTWIHEYIRRVVNTNTDAFHVVMSFFPYRNWSLTHLWHFLCH